MLHFLHYAKVLGISICSGGGLWFIWNLTQSVVGTATAITQGVAYGARLSAAVGLTSFMAACIRFAYPILVAIWPATKCVGMDAISTYGKYQLFGTDERAMVASTCHGCAFSTLEVERLPP